MRVPGSPRPTVSVSGLIVSGLISDLEPRSMLTVVLVASACAPDDPASASRAPPGGRGSDAEFASGADGSAETLPSPAAENELPLNRASPASVCAQRTPPA